MYGSYNNHLLRSSLKYWEGVRSSLQDVGTTTTPATRPPATPVRPDDEEFAEFENLLNTQGRLWAVENFMEGQDEFDRPAVARWLYNVLYDWGITPGYTYWFCSEYARWKHAKMEAKKQAGA